MIGGTRFSTRNFFFAMAFLSTRPTIHLPRLCHFLMPWLRKMGLPWQRKMGLLAFVDASL